MRRGVVLSVLMSCSLVAGACGGVRDAGGGGSTSTARMLSNPKGPEADDDGDTHSRGYYYDFDDLDFRAYGAAADSVDEQEVSILVKRYYRAAAGGDGAAACKLLAASFAETVPAQYGQASILHGKTCGVVASKIFRQLHYQLSVNSASLDVGAVRVGGDRGYALLSFEGVLPVRYVVIVREGHAWRMASLIDIAMP